MKIRKKLGLLLGCGLLTLGLNGCNFRLGGAASQTANTFEEDKTVYEIQNKITDVVSAVEGACVGVYVATNTSTYSLGSGVIYKYTDNCYYVITNEHVVEGGKNYRIYLGEKKYYAATLIGSDAKNDIAVLRFSSDLLGSKSITPIDITQEDVLQRGQTVVAIGCPLSFDYYNHVTVGTVSSIIKTAVYMDATLNHGNSGGGLFNLSGRLIGINTSMISSVNGAEGDVEVYDFYRAIPMNIVRKSVQDIEKEETAITRPVLGISCRTINRYIGTSDVVVYLPDAVEQGVFVASVSKDGTAEKAGFQAHDIVYKANDEELSTLEDLSSFLNLCLIGDTAKFSVYRKVNGTFTSVDLEVTFV